MSTALSPAPVEIQSDRATVVNCYALFDKFFPAVGMLDYTEGIYHGDRRLPYDEAQLNQINYVLDEVRCERGTRVLEIGCGNGRLLDEARLRGARAVGITISPEQVALCQERGLDVRLLDYRGLNSEYFGQFDAVVANGPIEHFVHPADAMAGRTDSIYRAMFEKFHAAIDPQSAVRRLITTTIHFVRPPRAAALLESPWSHRRGSDDWHWAWLERSFGGFYPELGQFARCAADNFSVMKTVDGTEDYHFTSEDWLVNIRAALRSPQGLTLLAKSLPFALRHPRQTFDMLVCMLVTESWNWQFRGLQPPTRLLRQTWQYEPAPVVVNESVERPEFAATA